MAGRRRTRTIKIIKSIIFVSSVVLIVDMLFFVGVDNLSWGAGIIGLNDGSVVVKPVPDEPKKAKRVKKADKADDAKVVEAEAEEQIAYRAAKERGFLILVNKQNPLPPYFKPDDLMAVDHFAEDREKICSYLRAEVRDHFEIMVGDAREQGYELLMTSGFRSYNYQQVLWDNYVQSEGETAAARYSAKPGESEHQTGLAADVTSPGINFKLEDSFGGTPEGRWLQKNAHKYGFILRYPKGKESITGYVYEPWHIRYVGKDVAGEIYEKDITLEEYLAEKQR
ncbi:MAG: M15 family metallopeptidase [Anaerovoracaceae bacterium]|jgi:D-alanyl-D-alanine carboxypeptidase